MIPFGAATF